MASESRRAGMDEQTAISSQPDGALSRRLRKRQGRLQAGTVLMLGFGGLLSLLVVLGLYAVQSLARVRKADSESSQTYLVRHDHLEAVRAAAYAASSEVRNYLMDPDRDSLSQHREPAVSGRRKVETALSLYRRVAARERTPLVDRLSAELQAYWEVAGRSFAWPDSERHRSGFDLLARELGPLRDQFLASLDEIRLRDQQDLKNAIRESAEFLEMLQRRLWLMIGGNVLLGVALAAATSRRLRRLEREANARYAESLQSAAQLEQLSHRLLNVQENERRGLARELHDEVGQSVGALLVELGQAKGASGKDEKELAARLHSAVELGERTLKNVRDLCLLLRPAMLDDLGLIPALHWQARETTRRSGIEVTIHAEEDELELSDEVRTAVYRVIQEALQNAARHSRAREVSVALVRDGELLRVLVKDDGIGFDPAVTRGMGLLGMQERILQLGGSLRIASAPGQGTVFMIDAPLKAVDQAERETVKK